MGLLEVRDVFNEVISLILLITLLHKQESCRNTINLVDYGDNILVYGAWLLSVFLGVINRPELTLYLYIRNRVDFIWDFV